MTDGIGESIHKDPEVVKLPDKILHAVRHATVRVRNRACEALESVARKKHAHNPKGTTLQRGLGHKPHPQGSQELEQVAPDVERLTASGPTSKHAVGLVKEGRIWHTTPVNREDALRALPEGQAEAVARQHILFRGPLGDVARRVEVRAPHVTSDLEKLS